MTPPRNIRLASGVEARKTRTPLESFLLAYAAMIPLAAEACASLVVRGPALVLVVHFAVAWAGALVCFFSGVHRGLSFRQPGGPRLSQLGSMMFVVGVASLMSPWPGPSLGLQLYAFASMAVLDPLAAIHGEAPRYFARLRPVQLLIPVASLAVLLWRVLASHAM